MPAHSILLDCEVHPRRKFRRSSRYSHCRSDDDAPARAGKAARTKMPHTEQYKDSVYFADKSMKQQFDMAVETAYQESVLTPVLDQNEPEEGMEQEETTGMSMGM